MFAGRLLRFVRLRETTAEVAEGGSGPPRVPAYAGGRLPLTTDLAVRVRGLMSNPESWPAFPEPVQEWLAIQRERSALPGADDLLVETFPRGGRWYLVAYCFEGRNAHQTLGMLLTRRMERFGIAPLGFVATDYVLAVWSAHEPHDIAALFDQDMLGDDLEAWMAESSMLRRTFRNVAVIAGLIDRQHAGSRAQPAAGDREQRPDLRRASPPPARPYSAARDLGRCRGRPHRSRPPLRHAAAGARENSPRHPRSRLAAGRAGASSTSAASMCRAKPRRIYWQRRRLLSQRQQGRNMPRTFLPDHRAST